jgi:hypothetical protein
MADAMAEATPDQCSVNLLDMIFLFIQDLEIFDAYANKYGGTFANIHIDDVTIYGVQILTKTSVSSGKNTIGAFENNDKRSLIAWIDPISEKFVSLRPNWLNSPLGIIILSVLIGGIILSAVKLFILFLGATNKLNTEFFLTVSIMISCFGLIVFCMKTVPKISSLEIQLRAALKNIMLPNSEP